MKKDQLFSLFILFFLLFQGIEFAWAFIEADFLEKSIGERLHRVVEFEDIKNKCEEMHVRCYLLGGTASAFAHYVHRDLERIVEKKDYNPYRFDYELTSMFSSNQDYDIVMDGTAEQIKVLQSYLERKYPYLQNEHTAWEVRPLRVQNGKKEPLLGSNYEGDTDFLKQHTDSHSQGMIELTSPAEGEQRVLDLKHWQDPSERLFLHDIVNNQIQYLANDQHPLTARYNDSDTGNPQIFSVIRYLVKALQYGVTIPAKDKEVLSKIIQSFDPKTISTANQYQKNWIAFNGKKLITNALDVERAAELLGGKYWELPEEQSLRRKLSSIELGLEEKEFKLLLNKEPLHTMHPCGEKAGGSKNIRARDLGIKQINHVVKNVDAFENILRPYDKSVNALISRAKTDGEVAAYGNGFYVSSGDNDYYETGMMIKMELNSEAVKGVDFDIAEDSNSSILIIKNKNCIVRNFEAEKGISLEDYFSNKLMDNIGNNAGYFSRMQRKFEVQYSALDPQEKNELDKRLASKLSAVTSFSEKWFNSTFSKDFPKVLMALINNNNVNKKIARSVLSQPQWSAHPEMVEALIKTGNADEEIAEHILSQPHWSTHPELVKAIIKYGHADKEIARDVLSKPHWSAHPELLESLIRNGRVGKEIAEYVLSQPEWSVYPKLVYRLMKENDARSEIVLRVRDSLQWKDSPELVHALIKMGDIKCDERLIYLVLSHWEDHPEFVYELIKKQANSYLIADYVLRTPSWIGHHDELIYALIKRNDPFDDRIISEHILSHPDWQSYYQKLINKTPITLNDIKKFYKENSTQYDKKIAILETKIVSQEQVLAQYDAQQNSTKRK